jgi:hypothetical protein
MSARVGGGTWRYLKLRFFEALFREFKSKGLDGVLQIRHPGNWQSGESTVNWQSAYELFA